MCQPAKEKLMSFAEGFYKSHQLEGAVGNWTMLSSAAVDSSNLQQGGWEPCLSVLKPALRPAGFCHPCLPLLLSSSLLLHIMVLLNWKKHFLKQVFIFIAIRIIFHFCYHGTDFLNVVFLVGWVKESGEQALGKCRDSSTWRQPSDSTRENNLYIVNLGDYLGDNLGDNRRLQTQQERIA